MVASDNKTERQTKHDEDNKRETEKERESERVKDRAGEREGYDLHLRIYECITTVSRISLDLTPVLTLSLWLYRFGLPSMLCISHSCAHSHSHSHSLSPTLSLHDSAGGGRALHHGHQLLDLHALRMPLAELLQVLILIREAQD